jgi:hypothetical protein
MILKVCAWHIPFGGFISSVRNNTSIARDSDRSHLWVLVEDGTNVTYWDGVKWAAGSGDLGTVYWWDHVNDITRVFTERTLGREPAFANGTNTIDEINRLKVSIDTTGLTIGSILETFRAVSPLFAIPLGSAPISRITYPKLFAAIGETYGVGDGTTTFGVPPITSGAYRGLVAVNNTPSSLLAANTRIINNPTDTSSVFSVPMGISGKLVESNIVTGATLERALPNGITGACVTGSPDLIYIISNTVDNLISYNTTSGQLLDVVVGIEASITQIFWLGGEDYLLVGTQMHRLNSGTVTLVGNLPKAGIIGGVVGLNNADHFVIAIGGELFKVSRVDGTTVPIALGVSSTTTLWLSTHSISGDLTTYDTATGDIFTIGIALDVDGVKLAVTTPGMYGWGAGIFSDLDWVSTNHLGIVNIKKEPTIPRYVVARTGS